MLPKTNQMIVLTCCPYVILALRIVCEELLMPNLRRWQNLVGALVGLSSSGRCGKRDAHLLHLEGQPELSTVEVVAVKSHLAEVVD